MYKYILWDHDGVLVDTEPWYFAANKKTLDEFGINLDEETYLGIMERGGSCFEIAKEQGFSVDLIESKREKRNKRYQKYVQNESIEIKNVIEVLELLSKSHRMAIITTARRKDFDLIHKNRNIVKYMDFVIANEDCVKRKPHPEPYRKGLLRFNADPRQAVVIEDSARGLRSAVAAGIDCIIIKNKFTQSQDFSMAKKIIDSIKKLPSILKA